jgi:HEAT repeat protein
MARSKPNALEALRKLGDERRLLDAREATLREEAAAELGRLLLNCDTASIEPAKLKQLIRASMTLGIDTALSRLSAP